MLALRQPLSPQQPLTLWGASARASLKFERCFQAHPECVVLGLHPKLLFLSKTKYLMGSLTPNISCKAKAAP